MGEGRFELSGMIPHVSDLLIQTDSSPSTPPIHTAGMVGIYKKHNTRRIGAITSPSLTTCGDERIKMDRTYC